MCFAIGSTSSVLGVPTKTRLESSIRYNKFNAHCMHVWFPQALQNATVHRGPRSHRVRLFICVYTSKTMHLLVISDKPTPWGDR